MAKTNRSPVELLRELRHGQRVEENFQDLCQAYYPLVYRFFQRKGLADADCWDLTQEVFVSVYQGVSRLREEDKFEHWLFTLAKHRYLAQVRKQRQDGFPDPQPEPPDPRPGPDIVLLDKEKMVRFNQAWQELPPQMRRCLSLQAKGHSYKEVAALLGIGVETVRSHLRQARAALRARLGRDFVADWSEEEP